MPKTLPPRFCQSLTNSASDPPPSPRSLPPGVQFKFMRQRSHLRNRLEYCVAILAWKSLQWAPRNLAFALDRVYTRLLDLGIPRLRRVARRNLAMALPEFTPRRHAQIVDGVFRSIARI